MRFVGERRALAAAVLAFFSTQFFLATLQLPPGFTPMMLAMGGCYLMAFFGVVSGWFWARWFSMGLAFSGLVIAGLLAYQVGFHPIVWIFGGAHLLVMLSMVGQGPQSAFDGRKDWRDRYKMDDNAANHLGKAIMRAGASLPYLILAGLAPKQGMAFALGAGALVLGALGFHGLVRLRTWGVLALGGAAVLAAASMLWPQGVPMLAVAAGGSLAPLAGALLLLAAIAPFARPLARALVRS